MNSQYRRYGLGVISEVYQMRYTLLTLIMAVLLAAGCSGNGLNQTVTPDLTVDQPRAASSHQLWGLWQFVGDPEASTLEVIPLRSGEFHANVVPFLEPPAGMRLQVSNLVFNGTICDVDVTLVHPFPGLSQYTGFDVAGILISSGTWVGFHDSGLRLCGEDDTRLLNPDGLTRWWNPREFPQNGTILRYKDGLLGNPDSQAHYNATVNGYKLFCDDLDFDDPISSLDPSNRNVFVHGNTNVRHYRIDFAGGVVFNYAVDANWEPPGGQAPYLPDDFPPEANRPEAWGISVTVTENTLWYSPTGGSGGNLSLDIDAWDHANPDQGVLWVDSPGHFDPVLDTTQTMVGEGFARYHVDIIDAAPDDYTMDILVGIESEESGYWDMLPGEPITGYFIYTAEVAGDSLTLTSPNGGEEWFIDQVYDITWTSGGDIPFVDLIYSKDDFVSDIVAIASDIPNTGSFEWTIPDDPSETVKVRVTESGGGLQDDSDDYFTILEETCDFGTSGFTLDTMYTGLIGSHPWHGISVSQQDTTQRIFIEDAYSEILVYNASDPEAGPVTSYDTGGEIYCNNDEAVWVDGFSEPGVDRIVYCTTSGGLQSIDWNGSTFVNHQTLPYYGSVWILCFTPDGDIILKNAQAWTPSFYFLDKSDGYSSQFLFQLQQTEFEYGNSGYMRQMVYSPELEAIVIYCDNDDVSVGGQLYALDFEKNVLFQDLEIFDVDSPNYIAFRIGIDIDLDDPDCRIVVYGDETNTSNESQSWHFARYSGDLEEKANYEITPVYYGPCRGDLTSDGTLWTAPHSGQQRIYEFTPPADW